MKGQAPVRPCCMKRHFGPICPDGLVMCCLCFDRYPVSQLSREGDDIVDVCIGCADAERLPR